MSDLSSRATALFRTAKDKAKRAAEDGAQKGGQLYGTVKEKAAVGAVKGTALLETMKEKASEGAVTLKDRAQVVMDKAGGQLPGTATGNSSSSQVPHFKSAGKSREDPSMTSKERIAALCSLGFLPGAAQLALRKAGGDPDAAAAWLVDPSNAAEIEALDDTASPVLGLRTGSVAMIAGVSREDLVGIPVVLQLWQEASQRWIVKMPDGSRKSLRPQHLQALDEESAAAALAAYEDPSHEFTIVIEKGEDDKLGAGIKPCDDGRNVLVNELRETGGCITCWNENNPSAQVLPGDRIVEVNGVRDDYEAMMAELRRTGSVAIVVSRYTEFAVIVDKAEGEKLGATIEVSSDGMRLIVDEVSSEGLIAQWNKENKTKMVRANDTIVDVNGLRNHRAMIDEIRTRVGQISILVVRRNLEATSVTANDVAETRDEPKGGAVSLAAAAAAPAAPAVDDLAAEELRPQVLALLGVVTPEMEVCIAQMSAEELLDVLMGLVGEADKPSSATQATAEGALCAEQTEERAKRLAAVEQRHQAFQQKNATMDDYRRQQREAFAPPARKIGDGEAAATEAAAEAQAGQVSTGQAAEGAPDEKKTTEDSMDEKPKADAEGDADSPDAEGSAVEMKEGPEGEVQNGKPPADTDVTREPPATEEQPEEKPEVEELSTAPTQEDPARPVEVPDAEEVKSQAKEVAKDEVPDAAVSAKEEQTAEESAGEAPLNTSTEEPSTAPTQEGPARPVEVPDAEEVESQAKEVAKDEVPDAAVSAKEEQTAEESVSEAPLNISAESDTTTHAKKQQMDVAASRAEVAPVDESRGAVPEGAADAQTPSEATKEAEASHRDGASKVKDQQEEAAESTKATEPTAAAQKCAVETATAETAEAAAADAAGEAK